jgi:hypothetical protein
MKKQRGSAMSDYTKEQYDAVVKELSAFKAQASVAEKLATEMQALKSQLDGRDAAHQREMAFMQAGLGDPSVREVFGLHFDRQAGTEAGVKNPAEWLAAMKAKPESVPAVLAALLPRDATKTPAAPQAPAAQWLPTPSGAGVRSAPAAGPAYTADQIANMSLADFSANYQAIVASDPTLKSQFSPKLPWGQTPTGKA